MTERDMLMAIYKAIEQMYVELTGKPLSVSVETERGAITIQTLGGTRDDLKLFGTVSQAA